ncbi:switch-associated protein 70 [Anolis carolinensis]|uniref:Switch-associated protein 70 n=1 Tax=Anolis carolinensis TaxID=28377 RepID=G1KIM9_ANOCA|nr:PREDICTED: switch-associated protein 70 [Anolis carolinensis]|eukprot:XP_003214762.1 PREDICTED: switch-associated protein 70 [Anolis carolinensis]
MGSLKEELLKPIWHAFTALDVDRSGKVSKSQLKVLSHNLCTLLNVPHDPVALEEHFRDDDEGPVSNQGYMPYLNRFILEKVQGTFDKVEFNKMCWTLCARKNLTRNTLLLTDDDAFKVWVIFNFLSEDKYPLVIVPEEIEYLLKKLTEAMGLGWHQEQFEHYKISLDANGKGLSAWELIELIGSGRFSKGMDRQTVSMAINEVFNELILDVLKQGYMWKKGHRRKNWTERWFVLKPNIISYYVSEDLKDKRGDIALNGNCTVEALPDKDGKKCLFLINSFEKCFEISASDKKKKQEWIHAIQTTINLLRLNSPPPHKEARQKRKELRQKLQAEQEELERQMKELQMANENKQKELETVRKQLEEAAARASEEEKKRLQTQMELQDRFSLELEREKTVRQQMEEQVAQKSSELEQYLLRVKELEEMYKQLQDALEDEKQARQDEETVRRLQARLLEEESAKRAELEKWHLEQQQTIQVTEAEKQELENQRMMKERALQVAMQQLEQLEVDRKQALEQYEEVKKKLEVAANKTKSWKDKVAHHEGLIRLIEPGSKNPHMITNWGPAAFTEAELEQREKSWKGKRSTSEQ